MICSISIQEGAALKGYQVVDVREYPEFASGAMHGARHVPLVALAQSAAAWDRGHPLLLVCKSGKRAAQGAATLEQLGFTRLAVLEGGIDAWRAAGLPVQVAGRKPWSLERQVRTIAGAMIVLFTLLGLAVSPWFFAGTVFVGSGLLLAGLTDTCLMASLLARLPWNRSRCEKRHAPA